MIHPHTTPLPAGESRRPETSRALELGASTCSALSLEGLCETLRAKLGEDLEITQREHSDGSSEALVHVAGALRASFRGRLITMPPRDGKTPRGPKEYYDLQWYMPNEQDEPDGGNAAPKTL